MRLMKDNKNGEFVNEIKQQLECHFGSGRAVGRRSQVERNKSRLLEINFKTLEWLLEDVESFLRERISTCGSFSLAHLSRSLSHSTEANLTLCALRPWRG